MFGFQHGRYFLKVSAVMLFFQVRQVEDRDDTLSYVGQVEVIMTAHQLLHNTFHFVSTVKHRANTSHTQIQTKEAGHPKNNYDFHTT